MRTTARLAVALATVLCGVSTASAHAQTINTNAPKKPTSFVSKVLLASTEQDTVKAEVKTEAPATTPEPAKPAPVMVAVNAGDSLSTIAAAHNTTWVRLFNANENIANPDLINVGDQVRVPDASEELADRPLPQPVVVAAPVVTSYAPAQTYTRAYSAPAAASYPVDSNAAKAFIYSRESGNNPNATNPNGCYGLGQDCNGVLRAQCGADYACQDAYFEGYAQRRYGGWDGAYAFWQANHWW
ncbi:MAG: LysM domain-containing protein [Candidatus Saccharimonadales bacterium]